MLDSAELTAILAGGAAVLEVTQVGCCLAGPRSLIGPRKRLRKRLAEANVVPMAAPKPTGGATKFTSARPPQ